MGWNGQGQLGGSLLVGAASNAWGRRLGMAGFCAPALTLGWGIIGLSQGDLGWICAGRILQGVGIMSSVSQVGLHFFLCTA